MPELVWAFCIYQTKQTMKKLEKTFLLFAFLTIASMPFKNVNVFAFFCLCADIFGVWWAVKTFKSI